jgi:hypothetical protein
MIVAIQIHRLRKITMSRYHLRAALLVFTLNLALVSPFAFWGIRIAKAQVDNPTTVQDYYLLMPRRYDKSTRAEREEILSYSETTVDLDNGRIEYITHLSGQVFEAALFKRPDGGFVFAYNEDCDLKYKVPTKLYLLKYEAGEWTDVTTQLLPVPVNARFKYQLPQKGTNIQVTTAAGAKLYQLAWKNGKFEKR